MQVLGAVLLLGVLLFYLAWDFDVAEVAACDSVVVGSTILFETPKVPFLGFIGPVRIEEAFVSLVYSILERAPAEPRVLPTLGAGVFAKTFATLVFVGAKWFAPTTFTFPCSYLARLFTISVLTLATDL